MKVFISILLILNLLVSTIGVQLHRIYCYCTGDVTVLLWHPKSMSCDEKQTCDNTTIAMLLDCCLEDSPHGGKMTCCKATSVKTTVKGGHACGTEYHVFSKLQIDLVNHSYNATDFDGVPLLFLAVARVFSPYFALITLERATDIALRGPPPLRPHGKILLPYIQSWLC